ncbi:Fungal specific transcription factor domain [Teratosphaeria destructans]|uniref:Fungal specific transcription factor domain n=1 Tax=Teratosphaeria destructans TaxID=418781 RepID=A0A9W7SVI5_9PEZI|nr:Fungal specific transcription factor domain [Teratosphaeria destructans]
MAVGSQDARPHPPNETISATLSKVTKAVSADGPKPLRRACDCCRKRKVKCDGTEPCTPCQKASIRCGYLQPTRKKGPKGLRSARVLHALRRIDDSVNGHSPAPSSPSQSGDFGDWSWSSGSQSHLTAQSPERPLHLYHEIAAPTSVAPDQAQYQDPATHSISQQSRPPTADLYPLQYRPDSHSEHTPSRPEDKAFEPESHCAHPRLEGSRFLPYVRLFFEHMFPIMPVIDQHYFADPALYVDSTTWSSELYCFLCAICAATIVQLDASIPQPSPIHANDATDDLFARDCLRERKKIDYVENTSTYSVMTSFFLFAYHGNHERHRKAWFYLQESITFAENMDLDDEQAYTKLNHVEAQWRRRLYWLLFITERAYAVQRRKHARLHVSVELPSALESEDPHLLNGFVSLANLFSAVDDSFISAWRGSRRQSLCNEAWLAETQKALDATAVVLDADVSETQHLDISITREWLHMLAWQMGVSNGLIWGKGDGGMRLDYPIELARKVVEITSGANALALDSHGIGMEQKLSDLASCLADVLRCTAGDTSPTFLEGKHYLNILLQRLSSIRGKESRYLKPLMTKMEGVMGYELTQQSPSLPTETCNPTGFTTFTDQSHLSGPKLSMTDSAGMLRTLSMSGGLSMPNLPQSTASYEAWQQRRPSGRVYDEYETENMGRWLVDGQLVM